MDAMKRYDDPEAASIWSDATKFQTWVGIEIAAAEAQGAPLRVINEMRGAAVPTQHQVEEAEQTTRHDVVAFLQVWRSRMTPETQTWVHRNMTSSDLVDTANAMRMANSVDLICDRLDHDLTRQVAQMALKHRESVRVGRTHGQTAEVTTWGHRMAEFAWTLERASRRLRMFRHDIAVGKLSGPVGDFKRLSPAQEQKAMRALNLGTAPVASQVVMRDVYVDFVYGLAQAATAIEAIALEVRLSSRTDTGEVAESFTYGQRGSSSMPHKNNPVTSEKLCGLARLVRAQVDPVMQGVALHHERDISHSSVERVALETATILTAYMTRACFNMLFNLDVRVDVMADRVRKSPQLMTAMAKDYLIENGVNPEVAWTLVANAYGDFRSGSVMEFDASLALNWASVNRHGPLPGLVDGWKPDFHGLLDLLDDPIRLVGNTRHVYADLESLVG